MSTKGTKKKTPKSPKSSPLREALAAAISASSATPISPDLVPEMSAIAMFGKAKTAEEVAAIDLSKLRKLYPGAPDKITPSFWVLPNKVIFLNWLNSILVPPGSDEYADPMCACSNELCREVGLFPQQKLVKEFFQTFSPYRGILLYHGLGVGKTCAAIAIAEGMENDRDVLFLSKASLESNFVNELSFCGNDYYKKNNNWVFVPCVPGSQKCKDLAADKGIHHEIIEHNSGVWLINTDSRQNNYNSLNATEKRQIDYQIKELIKKKYDFMHYDDTTLGKKLRAREDNPFDNKLLIIEEVHNLTNSMTSSNSASIARIIERKIMAAKNLRIVALSGTPLVNDIFEIAKLFNLLRGHIDTYTFQYKRNINFDDLVAELERVPSVDYVHLDRKHKRVSVTQNPYGFINNSDSSGIVRSDTTQTPDEFLERITRITQIEPESPYPIRNTALPNDQATFHSYFYNPIDNELRNPNLFKYRINGLVSYYRTAGKDKMPTVLVKKVVEVPMSDYQFGVYSKIRKDEIKAEDVKKQSAHMPQSKMTLTTLGTANTPDSNIPDNIFKMSDSYRAFSRMACSFVFPVDIPRPINKNYKIITDFELFAIRNYKRWSHKVGVKSNSNIGITIRKQYLKITKTTLESYPIVIKDYLTHHIGDSIAYVVYEMGRKNAEIKAIEDDGASKDEIEELTGKLGGKLIDKAKKRTKKFYENAKKLTLAMIKAKSAEYLSRETLQTYSPKYFNVMNNIEKSNGNVFVYSEYRNLEGLSILSKVLDTYGFTEFKIKKEGRQWVLDIAEDDMRKQKYIVWGGQGSKDDVLLKIYNNNYDDIKNKSPDLDTYLSNNDNLRGGVAKVFMTTKTGAEGITLKNVRQVHVLEPYWNYGRLEQVMGRAIRACSHHSLPEEERNVSIYTYLATFSPKDKGEQGTGAPTTDEYLYNMSLKKREIIEDLFHAMKEAAFDCRIHHRENSEPGHPLVCAKHLDIKNTGYVFDPSIEDDMKDIEAEGRVKRVVKRVKFLKSVIRGVPYIFDLDDNKLYTIENKMKKHIVGEFTYTRNKTTKKIKMTGVSFLREAGAKKHRLAYVTRFKSKRNL